MKLNYETVIVGERCVLVPYRPEHVAKYHEWMQDPALLEATASELLSLEDEYEMQESWRRDDAKCTFIVLARELLDAEEIVSKSDGDSADTDGFIARSLGAMVGDVNLFVSEEDEDEHCANNEGAASSDADTETGAERKEPPHRQAELDLMIAEKNYRSRGVGREAASLMMLFGASKLRIRRFFCKINEDNAASLGLFRTKLGFQQCSYAACFREVELELKASSATTMMDTLSSISGSSRLRTFQCPISSEIQKQG